MSSVPGAPSQLLSLCDQTLVRWPSCLPFTGGQSLLHLHPHFGPCPVPYISDSNLTVHVCKLGVRAQEG